MRLPATTSQTVGPFFTIGLDWLRKANLVGSGVSGERITIAGGVLDGNGNAVPDALLEIWQANSHGRYAHTEDNQNKPLEPGFQGYGRVGVDENGRFSFTTVKPGAVPGLDGKMQAPHIAVSFFARGLLLRLVTRIYFPEELANANDHVLNLVEPARRETLIAKKTTVPGKLEWNVVLQGAGETVFFDC
jgi:protocatechuate 3,4-dioxygenase, alpha subunit